MTDTHLTETEKNLYAIEKLAQDIQVKIADLEVALRLLADQIRKGQAK